MKNNHPSSVLFQLPFCKLLKDGKGGGQHIHLLNVEILFWITHTLKMCISKVLHISGFLKLLKIFLFVSLYQSIFSQARSLLSLALLIKSNYPTTILINKKSCGDKFTPTPWCTGKISISLNTLLMIQLHTVMLILQMW